MPVIVVANPKGGVGKSTLSTNIAGYFASQGRAVMLGDVDRQQSARTWLALRPPDRAPIRAREGAHDAVGRPPKGTTHVVLDTPAGLHGKRLDEVMKLADKVLIPLQPSIFDIHATHDFVRELLAHKRGDKVRIAIVGMRTREGTIATDQLRGSLPDPQTYVPLAAHGLTLGDGSWSRFERDLEQWQTVTHWLDA